MRVRSQSFVLLCVHVCISHTRIRDIYVFTRTRNRIVPGEGMTLDLDSTMEFYVERASENTILMSSKTRLPNKCCKYEKIA